MSSESCYACSSSVLSVETIKLLQKPPQTNTRSRIGNIN